MICIDSSALVAIVHREPEREAFIRTIEASDGCAISAPSLLETRIVIFGQFGNPGRADLTVLIREIRPEVVPFDAAQCDAAFRALQKYGKGMGTAAKLNMGASYALARTLGVPLLFKGNDFTATDITPAVARARFSSAVTMLSGCARKCHQTPFSYLISLFGL